MFIDDEKQTRDDRRRERRAAFYITVTALAACVLMIVGLMNVARAGSFDDTGLTLRGEFGETHVLLAVNPADHLRSAGPMALLGSDVVIDPTTTASIERNGHEATTIGQRLTAALTLSGFIAAAGVSQLISRGTHRHASPAPWRSEA